MGGDAGVTSTLGSGSTFWFTAKLKKGHIALGQQALSTIEAEKSLRDGYTGYRVLVVDDEPINREVAQGLLEDVGLRVDTAVNGSEALAKAQANPYSLILMDMQMPELDGLSATKRLRESDAYRQTPIIAMTANAFAEDKARCLDAGMNDFLIKPFEPELLYGILLKWLARHGR